MEYIDQILTWINSFSPFLQSLIASTVFGFVAFIIQFISKKAKKSSSELFKAYQRRDLYKHIIHKEFLNSSKVEDISRGYFLITIETFRWVLRGILIMVFFLGVSAMVEEKWFMLLGYWFVFNCMLEAFMWLKDKSSESEIEYINPEIRDELFQEIGYLKSKEPEKK